MDDIEERSPKRQRRSLSPDSSLYPSASAHVSHIEAIESSRLVVNQTTAIQSDSQADDIQQSAIALPVISEIELEVVSAAIPSTPTHPSERDERPGQAPVATLKLSPQPSPSPLADVASTILISQSQSDTHMRTDHDRQTPSLLETIPPTLSKPLGAMALICQKSHPRSAPHPSQDLISLYRVGQMASSVARKDPITGEKINKLRKSYEGKLKALGLPGRNKATDNARELLELPELPNPEESAHDPSLLRNRSAEGPLANSLLEKLNAALTFQPGQLPREHHEHWKSILAFEDPKAVVTPNTAVSFASSNVRTPLNITTTRTAVSGLRESSVSRPPSPVSGSLSARPERAGKKRRYDDASFEGYAEGYRDDSDCGLGPDDRRNSASRKRRRELSQGSLDPSSGSHLGEGGAGAGGGQFGQSSGSRIGVNS